MWLSLMVLVFAISLDGFGIAVAYGLSKTKIPHLSVLIIAVGSSLVLVISMQIGNALLHFISVEFANQLGALILIAIGFWGIYQIYNDDKKKMASPLYEGIEKAVPENSALFKLEISRLGVIIQILKSPMNADLDKSGVIIGGEAVLLGLALAIDAAGAGIGASFIGLPLFITVLVAGIMNYLSIMLGVKVGLFFSHVPWITRLSYMPGTILILFGVLKML